MAEATISQIKVGNTTYDIHDAMWDNSPVNLGPWEIGDTEGINIYTSNICPHSETASEDSYGLMLGLSDSDNQLRSYIRHVDGMSGNQGIQLQTCRYVSGDNNPPVCNGIQLRIDSSGNRSVAITDPEAWRAALFNDAWHTGTFSSPFSNYSSDSAPRYRRDGNIVSFYGIATVKSDQDATQKTLFTLPPGYRPTGGTRYLGRTQGSTVYSWLLTVNVGGAVLLDRYGITSEISVPAGVWLPFSGVFVV